MMDSGYVLHIEYLNFGKKSTLNKRYSLNNYYVLSKVNY